MKKIFKGILTMIIFFAFIITLSSCNGEKKHKHTLEFHAEVSPTCELPGRRGYYQCTDSNCGLCFNDEGGYNQVELSFLEIPSLGHDASVSKVIEEVDSTCNSEAYKLYGIFCSRCDKKIHEQKEYLNTQYKEHEYIDYKFYNDHFHTATCKNCGSNTYVKHNFVGNECVDCKKKFTPQIGYYLTDEGYIAHGNDASFSEIYNTIEEIIILDEIEGIPVVGIQNSAFSSCFELKKIYLPNTIKHIGYSCFSSCTKLESIKLPEKLETIGEGAFEFCHNLKSITLPVGIKSIPQNCFNFCIKLETVILPDNLEVIGDSAFKSCRSLISIKLPSNLKKISSFAFDDCTQLTSINIPSSVEEIGQSAFNCSSLTEVVLNEGLLVIGIDAFSSTPIKEWKLPNSIRTLESGAIPIRNVRFNIPSSLIKCDYYTFGSTIDIGNIEDYIKVFSRINNFGSYINYYTNNWISNGKVITELNIPEGINHIPTGAFNFINTIESVTLPSIINIDVDSFNVDNIKTLNLYEPEQVFSIDCDMFPNSNILSNGKPITSLNVPDFVENIPEKLLRRFPEIEYLSLHKTFSQKDIYTQQISDLITLNVPDSNYWVNNYEILRKNFASIILQINNSDIVSVPEGVTVIPRNMFYSVSGVHYVILPSTLESIEEYAFWGTGLCSLDMSLCDKLTRIESGISMYNHNLSELIFPKNNHISYIGPSAFFGCNLKDTIVLSEGITTIGEQAFSHGYTPTSFILPSTLELIHSNAFGTKYESNVENLYFKGSYDKFNITVEGDRDFIFSKLCFYTEQNPYDNGFDNTLKYWYYNKDGLAEVWKNV